MLVWDFFVAGNITFYKMRPKALYKMNNEKAATLLALSS